MKTGGPKNVRKRGLLNVSTASAWWYYNKRGIDVCEQHDSGAVTMARITWPDLFDAFQRTRLWEGDK